MKNGSIISGNMNIAEHFNSFFANVGPTLAKGIPKSDRHVESFLGDRVTHLYKTSHMSQKHKLSFSYELK